MTNCVFQYKMIYNTQGKAFKKFMVTRPIGDLCGICYEEFCRECQCLKSKTPKDCACVEENICMTCDLLHIVGTAVGPCEAMSCGQCQDFCYKCPICRVKIRISMDLFCKVIDKVRRTGINMTPTLGFRGNIHE